MGMRRLQRRVSRGRKEVVIGARGDGTTEKNDEEDGSEAGLAYDETG